MDAKDILVKIIENTKEHSSDVMIGAGVAGYFGAIILTAIFSPKMKERINSKKKELNKEKLSFKENAECVWKETTAISAITLASTALVLKAHSDDLSEIAIATAAATLYENSLKDYKNKAKEILGEEKEKDIQNKANEERINRNKKNNKCADVTIDGTKVYLFRDLWYGNEFYCTKSVLENAMTRFKGMLAGDIYATVEDFYDYIRDYFPRIPNPDAHRCEGWNSDEASELEIDQWDPVWSSDDMNEIVIGFGYNVVPRRDYRERY